MRYINSGVILSLVLAIVACSANPPAPVIDRMSSSKATTNKPSAPSKQTKQKIDAKSADWRPDNYTVKKGDTLISIGLEYGYDYKEIAQTNDLSAPYNIKVGQTLKLKQTKDKLPTPENKLVQENSDGVSTYALNNDSSSSATSSNSANPVATVLSSPKAIREPYSDAAFNKAPPLGQPSVDKAASNVATTKNTPTTLADNVAKAPADLKSDTKAESTDDIDWAWPTKGKISAPFNESSNKGVDIAGSAGQAINAAAGGKVIYSGSDLRGYGKLVIIKHNANYLSVYAHNSNLLVKEGQQVASGQKIAEMGSTDSDKVKLHFEIRKLGKSVDPSKYLTAN